MLKYTNRAAWVIVCLVIALSSRITAADTVLFSDNFDSEAFKLNVTNSLPVGDPGLANWNITLGNIDVIGYEPGSPPVTSFHAVSGNDSKYLDLSGNTAGAIESKSSFSFNAGTSYVLSFDLAYRFAENDSVTVTVDVGNEVFSFNAPTGNPVVFIPKTISFDGSGASSTIKFASSPTPGNNAGVYLDNVVLTELSSVTVVPLPSSLWAGLVLLACCGLTAWLKQNRVMA